jgi:hypothetical protein
MHDNLSYEIEDMAGLIARFYQHIWAMADLRERLKYHEDLEEQVLKSTGTDLASMVGEFMYYYNLKKENRLLELPCKVGDVVYILSQHLDVSTLEQSHKILERRIHSTRGNRLNPLIYITANEDGSERDFTPSAIGKRVFLTKEEAEKALAEMEKKDE